MHIFRNLLLSGAGLGVIVTTAAADPRITGKIGSDFKNDMTAEGFGGGGGEYSGFGALQGGLIGTGLGTYFGGPLGGFVGGKTGEMIGGYGYPVQMEAAEKHFEITGEAITKAGNKQ